MKTIIAGSRDARPCYVDKAIQECPWQITSVVCGMARGADTLGRLWAEFYRIPVVKMPANWSHGKDAGKIRNTAMGRSAEALLAVWDGVSTGTRHMIKVAEELGLRIHVYHYRDLVYVWDKHDQLCYTTERHFSSSFHLDVLGEVEDPGPRRHHVHGNYLGTQADLERACRARPGWNPLWTYPTLGEDPIPF